MREKAVVTTGGIIEDRRLYGYRSILVLSHDMTRTLPDYSRMAGWRSDPPEA